MYKKMLAAALIAGASPVLADMSKAKIRDTHELEYFLRVPRVIADS